MGYFDPFTWFWLGSNGWPGGLIDIEKLRLHHIDLNCAIFEPIS
jgi:hypothetical protein